jgi:bifunctional DNA-binding transcriptional regulator/antitoxin component of YhaV-PrlF toxin-antitoxin module
MVCSPASWSLTRTALWNRASEPIQLGDNQGVALASRGKRVVEPGTGTASAGQSVVEVDPILGDSELAQDLTLRSEVLLLGRAARVADQDSCPRRLLADGCQAPRWPALGAAISAITNLTTTTLPQRTHDVSIHQGPTNNGPGGRSGADHAAALRAGKIVKEMSKLSSKHQVTIPVSILREAGLAAGDELVIRASGQGRIEIERSEDLVRRFAGSLPAGTYPNGYLDELRGEWRE